MKKTRITDLEKFALQHIIRPYQTRIGFGFDDHIKKIPFSLDKIASMMLRKNEWSKIVLNRIVRIGFCFPSYINHRLVTVINFHQRAYDKKPLGMSDEFRKELSKEEFDEFVKPQHQQ